MFETIRRNIDSLLSGVQESFLKIVVFNIHVLSVGIQFDSNLWMYLIRIQRFYTT